MAVAEADSTWPIVGKGAGLSGAFSDIWSVERERVAVWSPLLLVVGIWTYFNLATEPQAWVSWVLLSFAAAVVFRWRSNRLLLLIAIICLGFAVAKLRTDWMTTSLLRAYAPDTEINGHVADVVRRSRGSYVIIIDVDAAKLPASEIPNRIRLTWRGKKLEPPTLGQSVAVTADLSPLPRPAAPGTFDYGRQLFFQSIGATGRIKTLTPLAGDMPWRYQMRAAFHNLRSAIGERIRASIPGPLGSIADALVTGERAAIPRGMNESLQASGLFHILSISGLHMTLVAGGVFWASRAALALSPHLALQYPIKKWAAGAALFVGLLYMLLADGGAATERSFLMIGVMFFAILVDRPAISLHNLAVAAVLILLWQPEQAVSASFQMSFLAVMGLAAFYPMWSKTEQRFWPLRNSGLIGLWSRRVVLLFIASLLTSLIAGSLSGIAAAHHFGRVAPYGVVANALALPVTGVAIMPMAMLAVLLMPFGLEGLPLSIMERGLEVMMWISDWVASWQNANLQLPLLSVEAAMFASFAAAALCLPVSRLRWLALPLVCAAAYFTQVPKPTLLVDERAGNVAVMTKQGLTPALPGQAPMSLSRWMDIFGDNATSKVAAQRAGWTCADGICRTKVRETEIAFLSRAHETKRTCPKVDVLVAAYPLRRMCRGKSVTIDRFDVWRNGAYAVFVDDGSVEVVNSKSEQGKRPWVYEARAREKKLK